MGVKVFKKDKYATWKVIYDLEKNKASEKAGKIFSEMDKAKKDQDKGITLGSLGRIHYRRYEHDPSPLAFFFSYVNNDIRSFIAINTHYLLPNSAVTVAKKIMAQNRANIKQGRNLKITYNMIKSMNLPVNVYRNYKFDKVSPIEYIPVDDWIGVLKNEKSPWQGKIGGPEKKKSRKDRRKASKKRAKKRLKKRR